jgi:hypothetical protein
MVNISIPGLQQLQQNPTLKKENRTSFFSNDWKSTRTKFIRQTTVGGILFMLWFIVTCTYFFGTLYRSSGRHRNFRVLAVDFDEGVIGQSVKAAYQQLNGPEFFNLEFHSPLEFPTEDDMFQAVRRGDFWGAISASEGASNRLEAAIQGGQAAATYDPREALHIVWNEQYYPAFALSVVYSGLQTLIGATRVSYNHINGTQASRILNQQDPAAVQALLNPIAATESNVKEASFGNAILLNTVGSVTPVLSQFFFLLALNGIMRGHQLYSKLTIRSSIMARRIAGLVYAFGAALCQAGYSWEFKENWDVNGNQFVLTWMTFWLVMMGHQLFLETIMTLAPLQAMPFTVLAWVFLNISSTLSPLELQAGFFHWAIALPGHNAYLTLVTIWSGGSRNRLYRTLPIMFSWVVAGLITTTLAHCRACHLAFKLERADILTEELHKDEAMGQSNNGVPISRQTTMERNELDLLQQRQSAEQRQIYGPSIPMFAGST